MQSSGSVYFDKNTSNKGMHKRNNIWKIFSVFVLSFIALFLFAQPIVGSISKTTNNSKPVNASPFGIFCYGEDSLGSNMSTHGWRSFANYPSSDADNRNWTLQEAFGNNVMFTDYYGEKNDNGNWFLYSLKRDLPTEPGNISSKADKLKGLRSLNTCLFGDMTTVISTQLLQFSNAITSLAGSFSVYAFDSNLICSDPTGVNSEGNCINLLKVIGGTGSSNDGGIVGALTSSVYFPLLIIVVMISALWVLNMGLIKRQFRQALFGALWIVLSVVVGLIFLFMPALISKAPMYISNSIGSCVIGSFTGNNCLTNSSGGGSLTNTSTNICKGDAGGLSTDEEMQFSVNNLTCSIWKSFVLEPYSQGEFGESFEDLDVKSGDVKDVVKKSGIDADTFCVPLGTSASVDDTGTTINFDRDNNKVCNLAAYQLFLMTDAKNPNSSPASENKLDSRWYNIIDVVANDDGLWKQWTASWTSNAYRINTAGASFVSSLLGGALIIVVSAMAIIYYLGSIILIAFAPLFFLIGIHPGRGKGIMLGWLEKLFSNILKYLTSAVFLIIAISFYGAVFGNVTNPFITLVFVLVLSGALFMYRKEIIDLIGHVNMGGDHLSNSFVDRISNFARQKSDLAKHTAAAAAGGAVGAARATGGNVFNRKDRKAMRSAMLVGARVGAANQLKAEGGNFSSNALRQADRLSDENKQRFSEHMADSGARKLQAENNEKAKNAQYNNEAKELENVDNAINNNKEFRDESQSELNSLNIQKSSLEESIKDSAGKLENILNKKKKDSQIRNKVIIEMRRKGTGKARAFANYREIANNIQSLGFDKQIAIAKGDMSAAAEIESSMNSLKIQARTERNKIGGNFSSYNEQYKRKLKNEFSNSNAAPITNNDIEYGQKHAALYKENVQKASEINNRIKATKDSIDNYNKQAVALQQKSEALKKAHENTYNELQKAQKESVRSQREYKAFEKTHNKSSNPDKILSNKKINKTLSAAEKARNNLVVPPQTDTSTDTPNTKNDTNNKDN